MPLRYIANSDTATQCLVSYFVCTFSHFLKNTFFSHLTKLHRSIYHTKVIVAMPLRYIANIDTATQCLVSYFVCTFSHFLKNTFFSHLTKLHRSIYHTKVIVAMHQRYIANIDTATQCLVSYFVCPFSHFLKNTFFS